MARVEIASMPWGTLLDRHGESQNGLTATLKNLNGTNATTWSAVTGGSSSTASLTADVNGNLPRFVDGGQYTLDVPALGVSGRRVEAVSGSVERGVVSAGSLGAAYTLALAARQNVLLIGTLTANCTITVTGLTAGCKFDLLVTQDATGGRTLTLSDGATSSAVAVDGAASHSTLIECTSPDGTTIYASDANAAFGADRLGVVVGEGIGPSTPSTSNIGGANRMMLVTFVARRNLTITQAKVIVTTASAANDEIDVGIYDSAGNRLGSAGATLGKLNAGTGIKSVTLTAPVNIVAGQRYYAAVSSNTTAAAFVSRNFTQATIGQIFGTAPPDVDFGSAATSHPLPTTLPGSLTSAGTSNLVQLWLLP